MIYKAPTSIENQCAITAPLDKKSNKSTTNQEIQEIRKSKKSSNQEIKKLDFLISWIS